MVMLERFLEYGWCQAWMCKVGVEEADAPVRNVGCRASWARPRRLLQVAGL